MAISEMELIRLEREILDDLPGIEPLSEYAVDPPKLPEELISGVLRRGHKMLISGSSKAGKSFLLMELCVAISEGLRWLGFRCRKGRVLYVNLEIDPASCVHRFLEIRRAMGLNEGSMEDILIWNLRGYAMPLNELVPKLIRRVKDRHLDAVVIDPIYKVITGDENNATDIATFCNEFDRICTETGCSVIYCHHHSKGLQGAKRAMDRASGSGVFARDPDAQLDMIELEMTDEVRQICIGSNATPWRLEGSLREFPDFKPVNFWFEHPLHRVDASGMLEKLDAPGNGHDTEKPKGRPSQKSENQAKLRSAFQIASQGSNSVSLTIMSRALSKAERTVRDWINQSDGEFVLERGMVYRAGTVSS